MLRRSFLYTPILVILMLTVVGPVSADTLTFTELDSATLTVTCTVGSCGGVSIAVDSQSPDHWFVHFSLPLPFAVASGGTWFEPGDPRYNTIIQISATLDEVTSDAVAPSFDPTPDGGTSPSFFFRLPTGAPLFVVFRDLGDTPVASPEPSSVGLLSVGLAALGFMLRHKRLLASARTASPVR